jgi:hypothetical protein
MGRICIITFFNYKVATEFFEIINKWTIMFERKESSKWKKMHKF